METILKRDRAIVIAALAGISLLAWGYMVYEARAMYHTGVCCCAGLKMSGTKSRCLPITHYFLGRISFNVEQITKNNLHSEEEFKSEGSEVW